MEYHPAMQNHALTNPIYYSNSETSNSFVLPDYSAQLTDDEYFKNLPVGYRFKPTNAELIVEYLIKKINNQKLPRNRINNVNIYEFSPEKLIHDYRLSGEKEWYFFTQRDRKYPKGNRPSRSTPDGYWKASGADEVIKHNGKAVGSRKALVFHRGKAPDGKKTSWIMHEFTALNSPTHEKSSANDMRMDCVLCRIRKNENSERNRKRKRDDDDSHEVQATNNLTNQVVENFINVSEDIITMDHSFVGIANGDDDMISRCPNNSESYVFVSYHDQDHPYNNYAHEFQNVQNDLQYSNHHEPTFTYSTNPSPIFMAPPPVNHPRTGYELPGFDSGTGIADFDDDEPMDSVLEMFCRKPQLGLEN